jgi:hypothetical protein
MTSSPAPIDLLQENLLNRLKLDQAQQKNGFVY